MQLNLQSSLLTFLDISKKSDFKKPSSWPNIRNNAYSNSIRLLVDDRYPVGFIATVTGGYSVNIDGEHYDNYDTSAQFSMADWSSYTDTEGYNIDYPTGATKAHIIDIYPQTEGNNITAFHCERVAASGDEEQGVLWAHFNITNAININQCFSYVSPAKYRNKILKAVTAKNDVISLTSGYGFSGAFYYCESLEYLPTLDGNNYNLSTYVVFGNCSSIKNIKMKNFNGFISAQTFQDCINLEQVKTNFPIQAGYRTFANNRKLKQLPEIANSSATTDAYNFITEAASLEDTSLDLSGYSKLTRLSCVGTSSNFMTGFKGLRVSNEAPFNSSTSPQINVSYTGMDRTALVQLFDDLPTVTDGQTISIVGCTGTNDLTADDKTIATDKGWSLILQ